MSFAPAIPVLLALSMAGCVSEAPVELELPEGVPGPVVPEDNPLTEARFQLGRHLFYDRQLSGDGSIACADCHLQNHAFADPRPRSEGAHGDPTLRNSPGLQNAAYYATFSWASPAIATIEQFLLLPMFGEDPIEMGITGREDEVVARLEADDEIVRLFHRALGEAPSLDGARDALATFVRGMVSFRSPYDRYTLGGELDALTESEKRGMDLFFSETFECHHCHGGMHLSRSLVHERSAFANLAFDHNGLYEAYPPEDEGLYATTGRESDRGRFRPPSLRNVAVTAPYMHDGSVETLEEVLAIYAAGGQVLASGPHAGDGRANPNKSEFVLGFDASKQELDDLLAFLRALTDVSFLDDNRFSNPHDG